MKSELMQELAEERERDMKASIVEPLCTLLNNAICFMKEEQRTDEEIAEYLGTSTDMLAAIDIEDFETIAKLNEEKKKDGDTQ